MALGKLVEREGLKTCDESVPQLMIEEGLWKPEKARKVVTHQMGERRACFGELVQIHGSGAQCLLPIRGAMLGRRFVERWKTTYNSPLKSDMHTCRLTLLKVDLINVVQ